MDRVARLVGTNAPGLGPGPLARRIGGSITSAILMSPIRRLASQTAVYGLSSILGRFLNYLLVPLYTYSFAARDYGVVSEFYAYAGFLSVILGFGLETAYFRFRATLGEPKAFQTAFWLLLPLNGLFLLGAIEGREEIAKALHYPDHPRYVVYFALILAADALGGLPFARLRAEEKALRFAGIKLTEIGLTVGLNLWWVLGSDSESVLSAPSLLGVDLAGLGIEAIFVANLVASLVKLLLLAPEWLRIGGGWKGGAPRSMLGYALPMVVVGLAGMVNEMLDRVALKHLLPGDFEANLRELGIYAACYKLSLLMTLFVQAFRYAGEPFFFAYARREGAREIYARVMQYFVIFCGAIYLLVVLFLNEFQYFVGEEYRAGLAVVPVLLMANLFLGVYVNLSIWYKLTDRTGLGALLSLLGAALTVALNVAWIPRYGYLGAAWATLACYAAMAVGSWWLGRHFYPIPYPLGRLGGYLILVLALAAAQAPLMAILSLSNEVAGALLLGAYGLIALGVEGWSVRNQRPRPQESVSGEQDR